MPAAPRSAWSSTVLDLTGEVPALLRPGGITLEQLQASLGAIAIGKAAAGPARSPGMLASHYAPSLPLRLDANEARPGEALLAFGPNIPGGLCRGSLAQPCRRPRRGRRQFVRDAAATRLPGVFGHCRHADPQPRPRPCHQRSPAPRRRSPPLKSRLRRECCVPSSYTGPARILSAGGKHSRNPSKLPTVS